MRSRFMIAVGAVVLTVAGMTIAQQHELKPNTVSPLPGPPAIAPQATPTPAGTNTPAPAGASSHLPTPVKPEVAPPTLGQFTATSTVAAAPLNPDAMTIEQLLEAVKGLRTQKAELEKKEQAFMKVLTKKAGKLKEEIDSLTGLPQPVSPPPPTTSSLPVIPGLGSGIAPSRP